MLTDKIELFSISLLDQHRQTAIEFENLSQRTGHGLGWHYLLDLSWAANELSDISQRSATILDAGAGQGLMQWYLAERGSKVISADIRSRHNLPDHVRLNFAITGWRQEDYLPKRVSLRSFLPPRTPRLWANWPQKVITAFRLLFSNNNTSSKKGTVIMYNQDLKNLVDIPDNSVDAVVSISALEHNSAENLCQIVNELLRVLKPGGKIVATLGAAPDKDWYHEPSKGWCYTEETLRDVFDLPPSAPSNYEQYSQLYQQLRESVELRKKLGAYYKIPGDHGMPTGAWNPEYHIVGVVKSKE